MNIRAAVELADGWSLSKNDILQTGQHGYFGKIDDIEIRDALAAQLTRQVDALDGYDYHVVVMRLATEIQGFNVKPYISRSEGPDRTENTINAILDSGVLK
jgi:hypothetical protein